MSHALAGKIGLFIKHLKVKQGIEVSYFDLENNIILQSFCLT